MRKKYPISKRRIMCLGNSRVITIPKHVYIGEEYVILRRIGDILIITPYSKDELLVKSGKLLELLDEFSDIIDKEKNILNRISFYKKIYDTKKHRLIISQIRQLEEKLDKLRLYDED